MASEPIGALRADIVANSAMFAADMKAARASVQTAAAAMQKSLATFQKGANRAVSELFNMRNAAGVLAAGALLAFVKQSVKAAAEIDDTSQRLGISAEKFQELAYAAKLAGVEQEDFTKSLEQFNKRIGDFSGNVTEAQKSLGQLGLTIGELKGLSPDEQFKKIAEAMSRIEDPALKAAIASDLYGKSGIKLLNVMNEGAAGLAKYADEARRLGFILSNETIKKAAEADDEFDRIGKALKVAGINIAAGFLPALSELRRIFTSQDFQDGVKNISSSLSDLVKLMVEHKATVIAVTTAFAGMRFGAAFGSAFGKQGAVLGGITGGIVGLAAGISLATPELKKLQMELATTEESIVSYQAMLKSFPGDKDYQSDLTSALERRAALLKQITELESRDRNPSDPSKPKTQVTVGLPFSPEVAAAIENLTFKTRVLKGEFDALAPGFPELAKGLNQFGQAANENRTTVEQLSPQLRILNEAQLALFAAQQVEQAESPYVKMARELALLDLAFEKNKLTQEQHSETTRKVAEKYQASWGQAVPNIVGSFAEIAGSFGKENSKMAKAAQILGAVQALISTMVGSAEALKLPFPANIAAAAAVAAKGFALVATIKSQSVPGFKMGADFVVPGGIGGGDTVPVNFMAEPGERVTVQPNDMGGNGAGGNVAEVNINMTGWAMTRNQLRELIDGLNDMGLDGYKLNLGSAAA